MPIYTYECKEHDTCEVFQRRLGPDPRSCPTCGAEMTNVLTAPAMFSIKRDWNEQANLQQRDPYTQSKAQLTNMHRSGLERAERDCDRPENPVTEEAIQVGAKAIHEEKVNPRPDPQQRQVQRIQQAQRERREKPTD